MSQCCGPLDGLDGLHTYSSLSDTELVWWLDFVFSGIIFSYNSYCMRFLLVCIQGTVHALGVESCCTVTFRWCNVR